MEEKTITTYLASFHLLVDCCAVAKLIPKRAVKIIVAIAIALPMGKSLNDIHNIAHIPPAQASFSDKVSIPNVHNIQSSQVFAALTATRTALCVCVLIDELIIDHASIALGYLLTEAI